MSTNNYKDKQDAMDRDYRKKYEEWVDSLSSEERMKLEENGLESPQIDPMGVGGPELDETRLADPGWTPDTPGAEDASESLTEHLEGCAQFPPEREELQDSLRVVISELFESKNPALTLNVIAVAVNVPFCSVKRKARELRKTHAWLNEQKDLMREKVGIASVEDEAALSRVVGRLISTANARLSLEVLALVSGICYEGISQTAIAERHGVTRAAVSKRCVELTEDLGMPPSRAMKSEEARETYSKAQIDHYRENGGRGKKIV